MMGRYLNVSLSTSTGRPSTAPRSQELSERPEGCVTVFVGQAAGMTRYVQCVMYREYLLMMLVRG
jgi:hypothetical protein